MHLGHNTDRNEEHIPAGLVEGVEALRKQVVSGDLRITDEFIEATGLNKKPRLDLINNPENLKIIQSLENLKELCGEVKDYIVTIIVYLSKSDCYIIKYSIVNVICFRDSFHYLARSHSSPSQLSKHSL